VSEDGWAMVDGVLSPVGQATVPVTDLGLLRGLSVFETLSLPRGDLDEHLHRLEASCAATGLPPADRQVLRAEVHKVVDAVGAEAQVRITLTGSGRRLVVASAATAGRRHAPVRCVRGPHVDDPFLPGFVKHGSRMGWEVAVAKAGVDDVLRVRDGRFTEGTRCGIVAVVDGVIVTAPHDGTILASTTVTRLLGHAQSLGLSVRREGPWAEGGWDALYIASSTRSLAPVVVLDGQPLAGWCPVGRSLAEADDRWAAP